MAWKWSHAPEAYADAYENLHKQPREFLDECFAEWKASRRKDYGQFEFVLARWKRCLRWVKRLPAADIVADAIWERAEQLQTCDNGGWNAWMCPYGCHTVSFTCEDSEA